MAKKTSNNAEKSAKTAKKAVNPLKYAVNKNITLNQALRELNIDQ